VFLLALTACYNGIDAKLGPVDDTAVTETDADTDADADADADADTDTDTDTDTPCDEPEVPYDGVDNDCDPSTPDDDLDGDGYLLADDCDDASSAVNPGATEVCDEIDNDCDGMADGPTSTNAPPWYADDDGDGYGNPDVSRVECFQPEGFIADNTDCDDRDDTVYPDAEEECDDVDDDCDGTVDEGACSGGTSGGTGGYGGHRIDRDGDYYYALYNDDGFGIMGASDWYGRYDSSSAPEGVTWNEDQTVIYYNDLVGNVFSQTEPFGDTSTLHGTFSLGQIGGGVIQGDYYYVGDYAYGNIYRMELATGATELYSSRGSACLPYFGNSAMSIDTDGTVYAAGSCGVVAYPAFGTASAINSMSSLVSAVAMDAANELYTLSYSGVISHVDKSTGAILSTITISTTPSTTWTMAVDVDGNFVINYWGEQRIFSGADGSELWTWSASTYYPGTSGYYWYVTW